MGASYWRAHSWWFVFGVSLFFLAFADSLPGRNPSYESAVGQSSALPTAGEVEAALEKGVEFFYSISTRGGYLYYYTTDLKERWGETPADAWTIEVQSPGTPAVGSAILKAYLTTGNQKFLKPLQDAAGALILGQNELGGWSHTIRFNGEKNRTVSFDDNQTQGAIRFLMAVDQVEKSKALTNAINAALNLMVTAQLEHGGWPHRYPPAGNYHDFATFNDGGINDCIKVMIEADQAYDKRAVRESLRKVGRFLMLSQLPPPQPGWAQQYNDYLQPAWARTFEPPSVCPLVTLRNIHSLMDLYLYLGDETYLEPIPDALSWLKKAQLPSGLWARFVELGTGLPMYYDRGRKRVGSVEELSLDRRTGYGYEQDLTEDLKKAEQRFKNLEKLGRDGFRKRQEEEMTPTQRKERLAQLASSVREILSDQDSQGRWVTRNDRYKVRSGNEHWQGDYAVQDRLSSRVFISNVRTLCDYLEMLKAEE